MTTLYLCAFALLAGFVDSVGGGGGLVQLPALLLFRPDAPIAVLLGTNKMSSITGTIAAALTYQRRVTLNWRLLLPAAAIAAAFSVLGARIATRISGDIFRPLVLVMLIAVTIYTLLRPTLGNTARHVAPQRARWLMLLIGVGGGFYDGFFGPGTGSLLMFGLVGLIGFDFLHAAASTKVINATTNFAALIYFVLHGQILWAVALPMTCCNVIGGMIGARMAIARGSGFVRAIFLLMIGAVIVRYIADWV